MEKEHKDVLESMVRALLKLTDGTPSTPFPLTGPRSLFVNIVGIIRNMIEFTIYERQLEQIYIDVLIEMKDVIKVDDKNYLEKIKKREEEKSSCVTGDMIGDSYGRQAYHEKRGAC